MPLSVSDLPQPAGQLGVHGQLSGGLVSSLDAEGLVNGSGNDQVAEVDHAVDLQQSVEFVIAAAAGLPSIIKGALWSPGSAFSVLL